MEKVLTNTLAGFTKQKITKYDKNFFRVMSEMAVAPGEKLYYVVPQYPLKPMVYNSARDEQVYIAEINTMSLDRENGKVLFAISREYNTPSNVQPLAIIMGGRVFEVDTYQDYIASVIDDYKLFSDSVEHGVLKDGGYIEAHLIEVFESLPQMDFYADWSDIATIKEHDNSRFSPIDMEVKSNDDGDSMCRWESVRTTGIDINYSNILNRFEININTGIICKSVKSNTYLDYIDIDFDEFKIRVYPYIENMPEALLPKYIMHPGQYLYYTEGDPPYESGDYTNIDGDLFAEGSVTPADYRTPPSAMMFVSRLLLPIDVVFSESYDINVISMKYILEEYDNHFPMYAIANYEIDLTQSDLITETGDYDKDYVSNNRYVGHYGRNPLYNNTPYGDGEGDPPLLLEFDGLEHPPIIKMPALINHLIVDDTYNSVETDSNKLRIDLSMLTIGDKKYDSPADIGYGYIDVNYNNSPSVDNVMVKKLFIVEKFITENKLVDDIFAMRTSSGIKLFMESDTSVLKDDAKSTDTIIVLDGAPVMGDNSYIMIDNEMMLLVGQEGDNVTVKRGQLGTIPDFHASTNSNVIIYDPEFDNIEIGTLSTIAGNTLTLKDVYKMPASGCLLVDDEIISYTSDGEIIQIVERACYGTFIKEHVEGTVVINLSYFSCQDIKSSDAQITDYNGKYQPKIELALSGKHDPTLYGALAIYVVEVKYAHAAKNPLWQ